MRIPYLSSGAAGVVLGLLLGAAPLRAEDNIVQLRAELDAIKAQYETRIQALEQRLNVAEQALAATQQASQPAVGPDLSPMAGAPALAGRSYASSGNEYNPSIGVILNGAYRSYENNPDKYEVPGVPQLGEAGQASDGFSIGESELIFAANIDDWFYGRLTAAIEQEDDEFSTSLEEAYVDTLSLPAGTTLRFGRFYSTVGYLNDKHPHSWDFSDQALPYVAFLDGQYGDDGIQFRWLAPTDFYLELGGELFRGGSYPAAGDADNGTGAHSLFAKFGGDVGFSHSWAAGLSWLDAKARDRSDVGGDDPLSFDGDTDLYIADFVWKWAPNGNVRQRNLIFQTEYLWRQQDGRYQGGGLASPQSIDDDTSGWYAQLIYQWRPRWRTGVRIDGLNLDDPGLAFAGTPLEPLGDDPLRYTLMFDYSNSEFSRIRLQFERDETGLDNNSQLTLQYIMSLGAHGAHEF